MLPFMVKKEVFEWIRTGQKSIEHHIRDGFFLFPVRHTIYIPDS
jgi:hypothetical protein